MERKGEERERKEEEKEEEREGEGERPHYLLLFGLHYTQKWKSSEKWERPLNTYHVNLMILGGCKVDVGGEGSTFK